MLVGTSVQGQGVDKTDVWTFWGFDWAQTTVMRRVNVTNLKRIGVLGQTTRSQSRHAPLVGKLRQGIGLIHELRQLARREELTHHLRHRTGIHKAAGCSTLSTARFVQLFLDGRGSTKQARPHLSLQQLPDRAYTAGIEAINVIVAASTIAQFDKQAKDAQHIQLGQGLLVLVSLWRAGRNQLAHPLRLVHRARVGLIDSSVEFVATHV